MQEQKYKTMGNKNTEKEADYLTKDWGRRRRGRKGRTEKKSKSIN